MISLEKDVPFDYENSCCPYEFWGQFWGKKTSLFEGRHLYDTCPKLWQKETPGWPNLTVYEEYLDLLNLVEKKNIKISSKWWWKMLIYHGRKQMITQNTNQSLSPKDSKQTSNRHPFLSHNSRAQESLAVPYATALSWRKCQHSGPRSLVISRNSSYDYRYGYFPTFTSNYKQGPTSPFMGVK